MVRPLFIAAFVLVSSSTLYANDSEESKRMALTNYLQSLYDNLQSSVEKPDFDVFRKGMLGYYKMKDRGMVKKDIITIIDFRISSNDKRLWIIDLNKNSIIHHTIVAHGKNTGNEFAKFFSNVRNSNTSSLGFYLTGEQYIGKYGLSLRLDGVEKGFNDNARARAIVMHPANYVSESFAKSVGRMGRSFGCPAIPYKDSDKVVKMISDKSVLFIYYPEKKYLSSTTYADEMIAYNYISGTGIASL